MLILDPTSIEQLQQPTLEALNELRQQATAFVDGDRTALKDILANIYKASEILIACGAMQELLSAYAQTASSEEALVRLVIQSYLLGAEAMGMHISGGNALYPGGKVI